MLKSRFFFRKKRIKFRKKILIFLFILLLFIFIIFIFLLIFFKINNIKIFEILNKKNIKKEKINKKKDIEDFFDKNIKDSKILIKDKKNIKYNNNNSNKNDIISSNKKKILNKDYAIVLKGETLSHLSKRCNITLEKLFELNPNYYIKSIIHPGDYVKLK